MSFAVQRIDHVEVFVRDVEAAVRWYGEVLGLREMARWEPDPVMIGAGGTMIALFRANPEAVRFPDVERNYIGWRRVAWRTDSAGFQQAQAHLRARGVSFRGPIDHESAWSLYFADPDGNPLEITTQKDR